MYIVYFQKMGILFLLTATTYFCGHPVNSTKHPIISNHLKGRWENMICFQLYQLPHKQRTAE